MTPIPLFPTWRIIFPTEPGPQRWGAGGEVAIWISHDQGATWEKERDVTTGSAMNHTYIRRPVGAHDDFYAFWADGNPDELSPSRLYFTNRQGTQVWRLPYDMEGEFARPEPVGPQRFRIGEWWSGLKADEGPGCAG